ncbi:MAG: ABC transporter permease [Proteobacteria bacterium]|nr:ABC transporter permease [Pseudomonadota bacterium]
MLRYALRRLAALIPVLLALVTLSFAVVRLAPGGPFDAVQGQALTPQVRANLQHFYGLDQPLPRQYLNYLSGLARGDFGPSLSQRDFTVSELLARGLPVSLTVGATALLLAILCGIPAGILAALRRGRFADRAVSALAALAIALPGFVTAPLLVLVFALHLQWLPAAGWEGGSLRYLLLPALTLALPIAAVLARLTRTGLLEVLSSRWILAARARGLGDARVLWGHALRPALLPAVNYLGPAAAFAVTGSLVVETVFGLPGTGRFLVQGAVDRDYPLVMGMVVVYGVVTLLCNLAADLLQGALDPGARGD